MRRTENLLPSLIAGLSTTVFAAASAAMPVTYQESVSGDLTSFGPLPVFALDIGTNTVSGTTGILNNTLDFDSFAFKIPSGSVLVAGSVQLADSAGSAGDFGSAVWQLFSGSSTAQDDTPLEVLDSASPGSDALTSAPLGAGFYNFSATTLRFGDFMTTQLGDYTFSLTLRATQAVPEPGTLVLAGLAFVGLAATRRRGRG
jgi:hypothetical protein